MKTGHPHSRTSSDASSTHPRKSQSKVNGLQEPFLYFDESTELSLKDKSTIYCSLVALVETDYPFDNVLQDRAVQLLKSLTPIGFRNAYTAKLVTDLVSSSAGSPSGFVESIATLLSSPHSTLIGATFVFLDKTLYYSSLSVRCRLMDSDLISQVLATIQPHTLPISGYETMFDNLIRIINTLLKLATPSSLSDLGITTAVDQLNHHEMIFRKGVLPSSRFVTFLITNQYILNRDLLSCFMSLLAIFILICPFHRPTLEFVLASPIVMANSSCLSFIEHDQTLWFSIGIINRSLKMWKAEGPELAQSGKRMIQALFSEGFEDTIKQMIKHDKSEFYSHNVVEHSHSISQSLGSNVTRPQ
ncbi:hypothetical protein BLNAU_21643 [Blattamonas nauphoetae]|uniref:Uncharacterized protein n=1 Tax=Blattamonas nauphoetae TaxID=2049346 RepID=A0ABQ9WVE9_9EUKA|nr:hypothetical protein BLNAU_21643 [Blattamonas nauphoetae]